MGLTAEPAELAASAPAAGLGESVESGLSVSLKVALHCSRSAG